MRKGQIMKTPSKVLNFLTKHTNSQFLWFVGMLLATVLFTQQPALAQFASGSIGSTVVDATGAVIPAAKVVLKNETTNVTRDTVTNGSGIFDFPSVLPGTYTVAVNATGLRPYERTGIVVTQGATLRLPAITLQVQTAKTEIEVVAAAEVPVPVDSGASSQTLNQGMVENISLNGRDAAELIKIMPGTAIVGGLTQGQWGQ